MKIRYAFRRHLNGILAAEQGVNKCKIVDEIAKHNCIPEAFELFVKYKATEFSKDVSISFFNPIIFFHRHNLLFSVKWLFYSDVFEILPKMLPRVPKDRMTLTFLLIMKP